jgi:hypothetical protein
MPSLDLSRQQLPWVLCKRELSSDLWSNLAGDLCVSCRCHHSTQQVTNSHTLIPPQSVSLRTRRQPLRVVPNTMSLPYRLSNTLLVTILISILSNRFAMINSVSSSPMIQLNVADKYICVVERQRRTSLPENHQYHRRCQI